MKKSKNIKTIIEKTKIEKKKIKKFKKISKTIKQQKLRLI